MKFLNIPESVRALPTAEIAGEVNDSLRDNPRLIITAPPGSGKSTLLPITIHQGFEDGKIIMLEPRRAAARQIALRMAQILDEAPGKTVGYRMRFESKVSESTRIEVVTEGVMERLLIEDPTLEGVAAVIFDEFHERSLSADLCLALILEAQNVIRPDLKIVIMSATIETEQIRKALNAPIIDAKGRMYGVDVIHCDDIEIDNCVPAMVSTIRRAYWEQEGNILAFLPGYGEIAKCSDMLGQVLQDAVIMPLHGNLSLAEQCRAIEYNPEASRKIVLATPIAETSLTIQGIRTVVDSGLYRAVRFDPTTGLSRLETDRISQDMAVQRTGRAGRLSEGVCYRLWSKATEHRMSETRRPEIMTADLSGMILTAASWGCKAPESLPWLTAPPSGHIADARRLLRDLGALDTSGRITNHGKLMSALPCNPRIANMLLLAKDSKERALAADIAAVLEEKDMVSNDNDADINTRIELLRAKRRRRDNSDWRRIRLVAEQYRRMVRAGEDNSAVNSYDTGRLLASAFPERIAMRLRNNIYRIPGGENISLNETDDMVRYDFLAVASMGRRIFLASPVNKETLENYAKVHDNVSWNSREGRIVSRQEIRIGVLVISAHDMAHPSPEIAAKVVSQAAVKEGLTMFDFNDNVLKLQQRIATVADWHPEFKLPDITTETLLTTSESWLPMYIGKATTVQELRRIDMCQVISGIVGYELMSDIDRIAPTHYRLPGGYNVRIDYRPGNPIPVLSARLQDCFGLHDTPKLDDGRRPVLMELLSPGYKPVQLTQDLQGFWRGTYFEVRKELKRRYPKHRWPDDPQSFYKY